ncbi:MAG: hypothetical protein E7464_06390 [Ruminococcaceae bacterium]|nr:hypothetical protein [Oscillospiraceae bacterium]
MRKLSYRHKRRILKALKILGLTALILTVLMVFVLIYMQRYIVYTSDGAHLDFSRNTLDIPLSDGSDIKESPDHGLGEVEIVYMDEAEATEGKLKQINGVYITTDMLRNNPKLVLEGLKELDNTTAVMIDVKDRIGNFYYNTEIAGVEKANTAALDEIISYLTRNGFPMIARIPAFVDSNFALAHHDLSLKIDGGALWVDESGNYWLDPENSTVLSYQEQICKELSSLGFQEVVFNDFYYPTSGSIVYTSNLTRTELIAAAAKEVESAFIGSNLTISFCTTDTAFPVDSNAGRIYVPNASGANVDRIIASMKDTVANTTTQVVFLSDSRDTRFDAYGTLRPLLMEASVDIDLPTPE